jgi:hypothetical protein
MPEMKLPLAEVRRALDELAELFGQVDPTMPSWLEHTPEVAAAMERITAERQSLQAKIDAKFEELRAIVAAWESPEAWKELRQTHPDLVKELSSYWIRPAVPGGGSED